MTTCDNSASPLGLSFGNVSLTSDIVSRGLYFWVGNPQQVFSLKPSTGSAYTFLYNDVDCKNDTDYFCLSNYGGIYNTSKSTTFSKVSQTNWNGTGISGLSGAASTYIYFNDEIQFGKNGTVYGFPMFTRAQGYNTGGGVGIGAGSTFIDQVVKTKTAPSKNWGLWVGSRSITAPADGALWIGGYDTNRAILPFTDFNSADGCETCVQITDLQYIWDGGQAPLFSNSSETLSVNLEPYTRYLEVPDNIIRNLINATTQQGTFRSNIGNQSWYRNATMGNVSVTMTAQNGQSYKTIIPASELFWPPRGPDQQTGVYEIEDNSYYISAFYNTSYTGYVYDWGIPFLTMNYLVTDFDNKKFRLAPARQGQYYGSNGALVQPLCSGVAAVSATAVANPTATSAAASNGGASSGSGGSSTNVGAIAGGVVGGVAALIILAVLAWYILRGKKREKALKEERDAALANGSEPGQTTTTERMSQFTNTAAPTVVSSVYGGGKAYGENSNVNQWLHTQDGRPTPPQPYPQPYPVNQQTQSYASPHAPSEATFSSNPTSGPTFSSGPVSQNIHEAPGATTTANMNEPFEMPAYQYR